MEKRLEALGPNALLRHAGADDATIARTELKSSLQDELERRPLSDRLERLMIADVEEVFLLALTRRFEASEPGGSQAALAAFLRDGVERRWQLIGELDALGNASRFAHFLAFLPLEVADFEGAEAVIAYVKRRIQELAAVGKSFLPPQEPSVHLRRPSRGFRMDPHAGARRRLAEALEEGNLLEQVRARAELGRSLATRLAGGETSRRAELEEAIACWRAVMSVWTREADPRKWGALMHNVGLAEHALGKLAPASHGHHRAALETLDAAMEALGPERFPWDHAAAYATRLGIAERAGPNTS